MKTALANVARFDHDPVTLECKGLLIEESRSNAKKNNHLALPSADRASVVRDAVGLDGTTSFWRLYKTGSEVTPTGSVYVSSGGSGTTTLPASRRIVVSIYIKPAQETVWRLTAHSTLTVSQANSSVDFTCTGEGSTGNVIGTDITSGYYGISYVGNGTYRCWISYVTDSDVTTTVYDILMYPITYGSANALPQVGDWGYFGHINVEYSTVDVDFPTSYIPTTTAIVTRAADAATMTGTNFSSWHNSNEGTFLAKIESPNVTKGQKNALEFNFSSATLFYTLNGSSQLRSYDGTNIVSGEFVTAPFTAALGYSSSGMQQYKDGVAAGSDANYDGAFGTELRIGGQTNKLSGCISKIVYYPKRLTNKQLQQLTKA